MEERRLEDYRGLDIKEYLDGRYFWKVLKSLSSDNKKVVREPLVVFVEKDFITTTFEWITQKRKYYDKIYIRIVIAILIPGDKHKEPMITKHSNLLIVDNRRKEIVRFEPSKDFYEQKDKYIKGDINEDINEKIKEIFPGYEIYVPRVHPQRNSFNNSFCNAYVLKYAYYKINRLNLDFKGGEEDIHKFALTVRELYGILTEEDGLIDIEYGLSKTGQGVALGGLGGAAIGGLVAGPAGLVIGAVGGAAAGGIIGSSKEEKAKKKK